MPIKINDQQQLGFRLESVRLAVQLGDIGWADWIYNFITNGDIVYETPPAEEPAPEEPVL